jgi:plasmid stabilization system protein ParE
MAKRIVFSKKAFIDIDRIIEFNNLRNQSDTYSRKFLTKLQKRLNLLQKHPLTGVSTDEENVLLLVWDQYYVFYSCNDIIIEIKSIYHQKEDVIG